MVILPVTNRAKRALKEAKTTTETGGASLTELVLAQHLEAEKRPDLLAQEDSWVAAARLGDCEAFDWIMLRYEQRLLRFLVGLVGDIEVAQDLCQDTFLSAFSGIRKTQGRLQLSAWLHAIALNKARSHHRKRHHRVLVSIDDHDVPSVDPEVQASVADRELVGRVLRGLPRQYAEPLLLQLGSGLSCREIGITLGCSEGAVKVRLMRAREAFKRLYEKEFVP